MTHDLISAYEMLDKMHVLVCLVLLFQKYSQPFRGRRGRLQKP
jgi:hypothetical protein